jgi:hypothetical protein
LPSADPNNDRAIAAETSRPLNVLVASHSRRTRMPDHVYKVVEIVGSSDESVSKAIDRGIEKAALTLRNIGWFEVEQVRGHIENGKVAHYQVTLKLGFRLDE